MPDPSLSIISTAKNEKDREILKETLENWELTKQLFEEKSGKRIEFIVVDAGGNAELPEIEGSTIIDSKSYEEYRKALYNSRTIKYSWWDSPSIGRNLGFKRARGKIIVFQDIDSLFSTGTEIDYEYVLELDKYGNYFEVMYNALRKNSIVAAAPSIRPRDSKKLGRRSGTIGLNCMTWLSTKLPTIEIGNTLIAGPSVPGCSFVLLREVALKLWKETGQLYDPELAIAEDYRFSRLIGRYGRVSYEKRAGTFVRTSRVTTGFDILKSVGYAIKWLPYYLFPDLWKYKEYKLRI